MDTRYWMLDAQREAYLVKRDASAFAVLLCQGYEGTSYGGQAKIDVWLSKCVDEWMHG